VFSHIVAGNCASFKGKRREYFGLLIIVLSKSVSFIQGEGINHENPPK